MIPAKASTKSKNSTIVEFLNIACRHWIQTEVPDGLCCVVFCRSLIFILQSPEAQIMIRDSNVQNILQTKKS